MGRVAWGLVLIAAGCADRPGACAESVVINQVRSGWCYDVDHPSQCPTFESGDDSDEYRWEFREGGTCKQLDYPFDCGNGIHEDIETECG